MSMFEMFSRCSGECCICGCGSGGHCLAGHGDDDFSPATKEQVIANLDNGNYPDYVDEMKKYLIDKFGYDYDDDHEQYRDIVRYFNGKLYSAQQFILKLIYELPLSDEKTMMIRSTRGEVLSNPISERQYLQFMSDFGRYRPCHSSRYCMSLGRRSGASYLINCIAYYEAKRNAKTVVVVTPNLRGDSYYAQKFHEQFDDAVQIHDDIMQVNGGYVQFCHISQQSNYVYDAIENADLVLIDDLGLFPFVGRARFELFLSKRPHVIVIGDMDGTSKELLDCSTQAIMNTSECNSALGDSALMNLGDDGKAKF